MVDLEAVLTAVEAEVRGRYASGGEFYPTIFVYGGAADEVCELPFGWGDDRGRALVLRALRGVLAAALRTQAYLISSEIWSADYTDAPKPSEGGLQPADRPDRQEMLMLLAVSRAGEKRQRLFEIKRDAEGMAVDLVQTEREQPVKWDGELTRLFGD